MALTGRGLWALGRPRPYRGRSVTATSTRWYAVGWARSCAAAAAASARQKYSCCAARRAAVCTVLYEVWSSRSSRCCRRLSCALERMTTARYGGPVEDDLTLIGFIGGGRTVRRRLRVGQPADLFPRVLRHCLRDEPFAFIV